MSSTKKNPKLNVRLLRRVKKYILAEPRRLQMALLIQKGKPNDTFVECVTGRRQVIPPCGTAACIAGWTCLLMGVSERRLCSEKASKLLNLQNDDLFFTNQWPEPFKTRYLKADRAGKRAKIAAVRIEHLISTGE